MSESKEPRNYTSHQKKIIQRYYDNLDTIQLQRLAELVGELFLAEGKKQDKVWQRTEEAMRRLKLPPARIEHLMKQRKPALIAELVKELEGKK